MISALTFSCARTSLNALWRDSPRISLYPLIGSSLCRTLDPKVLFGRPMKLNRVPAHTNEPSLSRATKTRVYRHCQCATPWLSKKAHDMDLQGYRHAGCDRLVAAMSPTF